MKITDAVGLLLREPSEEGLIAMSKMVRHAARLSHRTADFLVSGILFKIQHDYGSDVFEKCKENVEKITLINADFSADFIETILDLDLANNAGMTGYMCNGLAKFLAGLPVPAQREIGEALLKEAGLFQWTEL